MLFSSLTFIFIFLPATLAIYYLAKEKYRNYILLAVSLLFYSWGEPRFIALMILSIVANYIFALLIDKFKAKKQRHIRRLFFILSLVFNIGMLFGFKYFNFFAASANRFLAFNIPMLNITLPIGISFYTFQILSYVIDVYRKKVPVQKNIFWLGAYISFFPQLIAGPIVRYETIMSQLKKRQHSLDKFTAGLRRFIVGFMKKVIIANNVALIADTVFDSAHFGELGGVLVLLALLAYTVQIYYDFSGYSDMAIGLGKMFGFDFLENFNYPYISQSITDFWRRWHISLGSWFRDYVYIPLGGNRVPKWRWVLNIMIVWALTGLWHGASWNFILWGLYFGVVLLIEKLFLGKLLAKIPAFFRWLYAFFLINVGWLLFRLTSLGAIKVALTQIITFKSSDFVGFLVDNYSAVNNIFYLILGIVFMFPISGIFKKIKQNPVALFFYDFLLVIGFIFSIMLLINNSYNPFIYFRF